MRTLYGNIARVMLETEIITVAVTNRSHAQTRSLPIGLIATNEPVPADRKYGDYDFGL